VARYRRAQTLARPYSNISLSFRLTPSSLRMKTDQSPRLIADGNTNKEIAAQLSIVEDTVKGQVRNILSKLGANDRTHAAMIGLKRGIIEL
jgi:DNA-binding NarL/FixJ family response regulator